MDLRGYGGSDKPPRGYDTYMATLDAASVIRALGEKDAVVMGQGLGGWIAWCMPTPAARRDPRHRVTVDAAPADHAPRDVVATASSVGRRSGSPGCRSPSSPSAR